MTEAGKISLIWKAMIVSRNMTVCGIADDGKLSLYLTLQTSTQKTLESPPVIHVTQTVNNGVDGAVEIVSPE